MKLQQQNHLLKERLIREEAKSQKLSEDLQREKRRLQKKRRKHRQLKQFLDSLQQENETLVYQHLKARQTGKSHHTSTERLPYSTTMAQSSATASGKVTASASDLHLQNKQAMSVPIGLTRASSARHTFGRNSEPTKVLQFSSKRGSMEGTETQQSKQQEVFVYVQTDAELII